MDLDDDNWDVDGEEEESPIQYSGEFKNSSFVGGGQSSTWSRSPASVHFQSGLTAFGPIDASDSPKFARSPKSKSKDPLGGTCASSTRTLVRLCRETNNSHNPEEELEEPSSAELQAQVDSRKPAVHDPTDGIVQGTDWIVKVVVAKYRTKGHLIILVVLTIAFITAYAVLSSIQTGDRCNIFETAFLIALSADFVLVQPLTVAFTYTYRWLQSDEHEDIWSELHPYDGAERVM